MCSSDLSGRLAIVGALSGDADLARTPDGPRYGAEILAVEVQTLLRQAAPRELAPWLAAVLTLTVGLASRRWSRFAPLALALTFALALATGGWLVPLSPLVLAAVAGGWRSATPRAR